MNHSKTDNQLISKMNSLLEQVKSKLSTDQSCGDDDTSIAAANGRLAHLMSKLTDNRSNDNKIKSNKRK
jgi:division protein CdvB (Snf7/Vps24/ESCRT-III family)